MIPALLVLAVAAFLGASSTAIGTSPCSTIPPFPKRCTDAANRTGQEFKELANGSTLDLGNPEIFNQATSINNRNLDVMCTRECLLPQTAMLRCDQYTEKRIEAWLSLFCARQGGINCYLKLQQAESIGSYLSKANCALRDSMCNSSCAEAVRTLQVQSGCCAASYYGYFLNSSYINQSVTTCNISLGNICPGAAGWASDILPTSPNNNQSANICNISLGRICSGAAAADRATCISHLSIFLLLATSIHVLSTLVM